MSVAERKYKLELLKEDLMKYFKRPQPKGAGSPIRGRYLKRKDYTILEIFIYPYSKVLNRQPYKSKAFSIAKKHFPNSRPYIHQYTYIDTDYSTGKKVKKKYYVLRLELRN